MPPYPPWYVPLYTFPGTPLYRPPAHGYPRTGGEGRKDALAQGVAERTISDARVSVRGSTSVLKVVYFGTGFERV